MGIIKIFIGFGKLSRGVAQLGEAHNQVAGGLYLEVYNGFSADQNAIARLSR
jgi:hypothetical protein